MIQRLSREETVNGLLWHTVIAKGLYFDIAAALSLD